MDFFVVRKPIFDRHLAVYGYELIYSSGPKDNNHDQNSGQVDTSLVASSFMNIGIESITRNKRAFIHFNKQLLTQGAALLLPAPVLSVIVDEKVLSDEAALNSCKDLKKQGYQIIVNSSGLNNQNLETFELSSIYKVNYNQVRSHYELDLPVLQRRKKVKVLIDSINNENEFIKAKELGCDYFEGQFYREPQNSSNGEIPAVKVHHLFLLREIFRTEIDFERLEKLIKQDVALSYKLLKYINSIEFNILFEISSIRQALTLLGQKNLIRWSSLVALRGASQDQPDELIATVLTRARFCEEIARQSGKRSIGDDLFLAGLFSLLDIFMGQPMESILEELPLNNSVKQLLLGTDNELSDPFNLVLAYENSDWSNVIRLGQQLGLSKNVILRSYLLSLKESDPFLGLQT